MDIELSGVAPDRLAGLEAWEESLSDEAPLSECLRGLGGELQGRGLIITGLVLDGEELTLPRRQELEGASLRAFSLLQVVLEELGSFLEGTFSECSNSVSKLRELREEVYREAVAGRLDASLGPLDRFFDGLSVVLGAYRNGLSLLASSGRAAASLEEIQARLGDIELALRDVRTGVADRSAGVIADAFEYELPDHLEWLQAEFDGWRERLAVPAGATEEPAD